MLRSLEEKLIISKFEVFTYVVGAFLCVCTCPFWAIVFGSTLGNAYFYLYKWIRVI